MLTSPILFSRRDLHIHLPSCGSNMLGSLFRKNTGGDHTVTTRKWNRRLLQSAIANPTISVSACCDIVFCNQFNRAQFTIFSVMLVISQGTILFLPAFVLFGPRAHPSFRQFQPRLRIAATLFSWLALIISLFSDTWSGVFTVLATVVSATLVSLE